MTGLRLLIVSSRYWPLVSEAERYLAELAVEFKQRDLRTTIVSARWCESWPSQVTHQGIPVVRLENAPRGGWATYRYSRDVSRWIRRHRDQFDLILVGSLRQEAYAAIGAAKSCPVILAAHSLDVDGDCRWQMETRIGRRIGRRCHTAAAAIATFTSGMDELRAADYPDSIIVRIPPGVRQPEARTVRRQDHARTALAAVNHDLAVAKRSPIVLCIERLMPNRGISELIHAWRLVAQSYPSAHLWIIGDGPARQDYYEQVVDNEVRHQVHLPGSFDAIDELFQAADVFVAPGASNQVRSALLPAMAAGLPVVAVATDDNRAMIDSGTDGLLVPFDSSRALGDALCRLLESSAPRVQLGQAARERVTREFPLRRTADQYLELFQRLAGGGR